MIDQRKNLRIGIIGCGAHMSSVLIPSLRFLPGVTLSAVSSRTGVTAHQMAARWEIPLVVQDWKDLSPDLVDAIVCSGPVQLHEQAVATFMRKAIPLFVEKPLVRNLHVLRDVKAIQSPGSLVQVGYNLRFAEPFVRLREILAGEKAKISVRYHVNKPKVALWDLDSVMQSFLLAIAVHPLNLASSLAGGAFKVIAQNRSTSATDLSLEVTGEGANGTVFKVETSNLASKFSLMVKAELANGRVFEVTDMVNLIEVVNGRPVEIWSQSALKLNFLTNGFVRQMEHFVCAARGDEVSEIASDDIGDSIWMYELFEQLIEAAGRP